MLLFFTGSGYAQSTDDSGPIIPNVITPNNDGRNDRFEIRKSNDSLFTAEDAPSLTIVNRWGKTIYESSTYINQWDAYGIESGQYYYILQMKSGRSLNGVVRVIQ